MKITKLKRKKSLGLLGGKKLKKNTHLKKKYKGIKKKSNKKKNNLVKYIKYGGADNEQLSEIIEKNIPKNLVNTITMPTEFKKKKVFHPLKNLEPKFEDLKEMYLIQENVELQLQMSYQGTMETDEPNPFSIDDISITYNDDKKIEDNAGLIKTTKYNFDIFSDTETNKINFIPSTKTDYIQILDEIKKKNFKYLDKDIFPKPQSEYFDNFMSTIEIILDMKNQTISEFPFDKFSFDFNGKILTQGDKTIDLEKYGISCLLRGMELQQFHKIIRENKLEKRQKEAAKISAVYAYPILNLDLEETRAFPFNKTYVDQCQMPGIGIFFNNELSNSNISSKTDASGLGLLTPELLKLFLYKERETIYDTNDDDDENGNTKHLAEVAICDDVSDINNKIKKVVFLKGENNSLCTYLKSKLEELKIPYQDINQTHVLSEIDIKDRTEESPPVQTIFKPIYAFDFDGVIHNCMKPESVKDKWSGREPCDEIFINQKPQRTDLDPTPANEYLFGYYQSISGLDGNHAFGKRLGTVIKNIDESNYVEKRSTLIGKLFPGKAGDEERDYEKCQLSLKETEFEYVGEEDNRKAIENFNEMIAGIKAFEEFKTSIYENRKNPDFNFKLFVKARAKLFDKVKLTSDKKFPFKSLQLGNIVLIKTEPLPDPTEGETKPPEPFSIVDPLQNYLINDTITGMINASKKNEIHIISANGKELQTQIHKLLSNNEINIKEENIHMEASDKTYFLKILGAQLYMDDSVNHIVSILNEKKKGLLENLKTLFFVVSEIPIHYLVDLKNIDKEIIFFNEISSSKSLSKYPDKIMTAK